MSVVVKNINLVRYLTADLTESNTRALRVSDSRRPKDRNQFRLLAL